MSSLSTSTAQRIRVLVVGLGTMGTSHARAYRAIEEFELAGLCTSRAADRHDLEAELIEDVVENVIIGAAIGRALPGGILQEQGHRGAALDAGFYFRR